MMLWETYCSFQRERKQTNVLGTSFNELNKRVRTCCQRAFVSWINIRDDHLARMVWKGTLKFSFQINTDFTFLFLYEVILNQHHLQTLAKLLSTYTNVRERPSLTCLCKNLHIYTSNWKIKILKIRETSCPMCHWFPIIYLLCINYFNLNDILQI